MRLESDKWSLLKEMGTPNALGKQRRVVWSAFRESMRIKNRVTFLGMLAFLMAWGTSVWAAKPIFLPTGSTSAQGERWYESTNQRIILTSAQAEIIGDKIWLNETGGRRENLIKWNEGENFVSLGIGHFIWFPENVSSGYEESFPKLIAFFEQQAVVLPVWLTKRSDCPWREKEGFLKQAQSQKMGELRDLLTATVPQQVQFLIRRLESALPTMIASLSNQASRLHIREQFYRVTETPEGVYALVDYVNFKGEGVSTRERYNGQGWGLLQVLLYMRKGVLHPRREFADAAEAILTLRVQNAPKNRHEERWLRGWKNRITTYRNIMIE